MAQVLEWVQCKSCGRRHRWRAEVAGTQIVCSCGKMVEVPELQAFEPARGPDDTMVALGGSRQGSAVLDARAAEMEPEGDIDLQVEGAAPASSLRHTQVRGLLGMSAFGEFIFWLVMAATGFTAIVFAAIVVEWQYIAAAVVWGPLSFIKLRKAERRWQGNRSFSQAVEDTIGT